jgi:acyl-CoA thioester hydrolase
MTVPQVAARSPPRLTASIEFVVPFHDLDSANIVWHGHYAKYLELARDALMRRLRYSHDEMRASGYLWPVVELKVRYLQPARLGQNLRATATLIECEQRLKISYEIFELASGRRLTRAHTVQVPVKMPEGELLFDAPQVFRDRLAQALAENPLP